MKNKCFRIILLFLAITFAQEISAYYDNYPLYPPAYLPLYSKGTPRIHYNLVPQFNLFEDNLSGSVDCCEVFKMKIKSEWGEKTIVKDYLWRVTSYTPSGLRKQRKEYLPNGDLSLVENYTGCPNIQSIKVFHNPDRPQQYDLYTFTVKDDNHKDVLLTRSSGEQSLWKSILDPSNGIFKLEYYDTKSSDPDITYTNYIDTLYTHKGSTHTQTLKYLFDERKIMHTSSFSGGYRDGIFLVPPYSGVGNYVLYSNTQTHKIVEVAPPKEIINEGIKSVKSNYDPSNPFFDATAYCTIEINYNSHGDYSRISLIKHKLEKYKKQNGHYAYAWKDVEAWYRAYEYEYDSHDNWISLKCTDGEHSYYYARKIYYSDTPNDDIFLSTLKPSVSDILLDKKIFTEGVDYKIESTEAQRLVASTDNIVVCAIPTYNNEFIIRYYNIPTRKWQSIFPPDWDCDFCYFKDYKVVGNNVYMILSTHANGVGGTCCSYDIYKYNLESKELEELVGCACECEIIDNRIKATILEIISGDNWQNYKYKERIEWINMD